MKKTAPVEDNGSYGFYGRFKESFPSQIVVDATEYCNLACKHCAHPTFKKSAFYEGLHLLPELNEKMVRECQGAGRGVVEYIRYASSGEVLLHPQALEMIELAAVHSGTAVSVTTNGTLLTESKSGRLVGAGVKIVDISLDAFSEDVYAKIRIKGDLKVTRRNVLDLIGLARSAGAKTKVAVTFIEQDLNRVEVDAFQSFWKDQGADYVIVRRLHSNAGLNQETADKMRDANKNLVRRPCLYPWERIVLNARGCLSYCPADWTHRGSFVDYRTTTIAETWKGEFYQRLRAAHLTSNYGEHEYCGQCPDWAATRWPHEGRSFADMVMEVKKS